MIDHHLQKQFDDSGTKVSKAMRYFILKQQRRKTKSDKYYANDEK